MRKLTEDEYFSLQEQYDRTPSTAESFGGSGEHMMLRSLLRRMGFYADSYRGAELELADELLCRGYIRD